MKLKHTVAAILEENQDEYFCQFCTKPKVENVPVCSCSGNWFKLSDFDFDTQFSIAQQIFNSQKGTANKETD
jgi:ribosomal protein L37AE/L43A